VYGEHPPSLFLVFSNAGPGGPDALDHWYWRIHGPEAFAGGWFSALHRYEALGDYDARFLAVWEGGFTSREEVRAKMLGGGPKDRSGITPALAVVWSGFFFATGASPATASPVLTLTLVEGTGALAGPLPAGTTAYHYGHLVLCESPAGPEGLGAWSGRGIEGMAPHGPYRTMFDDPEAWPPTGTLSGGPWVSHWRPLGSLRAGSRSIGPPAELVVTPVDQTLRP
jgi:hypothetical protein